MIVTVGRIGKAHGIRGSVTVQVLTDEPDRRFAIGTPMVTDPPMAPTLVIADARWHSGRLLLDFDGVTDRNAAESLRGTLLQVDVEATERPEDPEEFYDHQLIGLAVRDTAGALLGHVSDVSHLPAQDLLAVHPSTTQGEPADGPEILIPFVHEIVVSIDLANGLVVDPPPGLLPESGPSPSPELSTS
jgi:16S rRNA processing protein RimM